MEEMLQQFHLASGLELQEIGVVEDWFVASEWYGNPLRAGITNPFFMSKDESDLINAYLKEEIHHKLIFKENPGFPPENEKKMRNSQLH